MLVIFARLVMLVWKTLICYLSLVIAHFRRHAGACKARRRPLSPGRYRSACSAVASLMFGGKQRMPMAAWMIALAWAPFNSFLVSKALATASTAPQWGGSSNRLRALRYSQPR